MRGSCHERAVRLLGAQCFSRHCSAVPHAAVRYAAAPRDIVRSGPRPIPRIHSPIPSARQLPLRAQACPRTLPRGETRAARVVCDCRRSRHHARDGQHNRRCRTPQRRRTPRFALRPRARSAGRHHHRTRAHSRDAHRGHCPPDDSNAHIHRAFGHARMSLRGSCVLRNPVRRANVRRMTRRTQEAHVACGNRWRSHRVRRRPGAVQSRPCHHGQSAGRDALDRRCPGRRNWCGQSHAARAGNWNRRPHLARREAYALAPPRRHPVRHPTRRRSGPLA